ncbi:MAG TPA: TlpA disulfide reductase family protein [Thiobacillus sp.]|jgi:peroxiredoxin|nr:TlpA family protein disulfide reductase [Gammaproteobacteria bacterium]OYZ29682.1 MAG: thioredoxin [Hydrogenophilales bacterium 16-64-40]OZA35578.1 MAG: thioredoxin [Hydrogenophilales bacterium 17-64-65]HQS82751.1 TlpA disulfide reductase family protein [Thiobacillus sp.]HQT34194.1 TlpA disulfide reductase family protein [Thiobacillus sp.]
MKFAKPALIAVAVLAIAGAIFYALMDRPGAPAVTFTTLEGKPIVLDELRGKVVLVNFWATSCPGCIKEMPDMVESYKLYRDRGFEIIAVAMSYDPPNYVLNFVQTRQLPFPVALDVDGAHARAFGNVQLTPTSFIIGKDGRILEQKLGELDFVRLNALLERELS